MYDIGTTLAAVICSALMVFMFCMRSFDKRLRNRFTMIVIALAVAIASFAFDDFLAEATTTQNLRYLTKILKDIAEGFIEYEVVLIVSDAYSKRLRITYALPFIVSTLVIITAPINPFVFVIDANNKYVRGNLGYTIYVVGIVYAVEVIRLCYNKWLQGHQRDTILIVFMIAVIVGGVFTEEMHIFHCSILSSAAIGIMFLYMYIYADRYNVDSVAKCYKRRCFYSDGARFGGHEMAIVSMDLNDLKLINDNEGHKAGDTALLEFANVVRSQINKKFILYRTGGDEFMLLGIRATKEETKAVVKSIREKLEDTPYSCSFGIAMYKSGDNFDDIVIKADKAMYADKKAFKKSTKRSHSREDGASKK